MTDIQLNGHKVYAMHHNPPGVKVAYEGLEGNLAYVAGSLGRKNTEDLKTFVTKAMTDGPLERFMASRKVPYDCIPLANRVLRHYVKREDARADDNEARAARHQAALERLHPILTAVITAVSRTEGRLGLAYRLKEHEVQILLVREFRSLNDTLVLILDVLKAMVRLCSTCVSHAFVF